MPSRLLLSDHSAFLFAAVWFAVAAAFAPPLATAANVQTLLAAALPLLMLAAGQTLVLIAGGIDLSITTVVALASVAGAWTASSHTQVVPGAAAVPLGWLAMLTVGAAVGLFNGVAVARTSMPPFLVTLTTMTFGSGLAIWLTQSRTIGGLPDAFTLPGRSLALTLGLTVAVAAGAHVLLARTVAGRWWVAMGLNRAAARVSGVPVGRMTVLVYVASGLCAAVAAIVYTGRLETGSPVLGQRLLLDVMAAAILGGTSLFGGRGHIAWITGGVLLIALIDNSLNLLGLSYFAIMMVKGAVILAAALLDRVRRRVRAGSAGLVEAA